MMAARAVVKGFQEVLIVFIIANILEIVQAEVCPNVFRNGMTIVTSPNYPQNYPDNYDCSWSFFTLPMRRIELVFDTFELESSCGYDYVALYYNVTENNLLKLEFCGNKKPPPKIATTHSIRLEFHSDNSKTFSGFRVYTKAYNIKDQEKYLIQHFLDTRRQHIQEVNKWGTDITRTAVALFLYDPQFFAGENRIGEEIAYEVSLQLMSKLVMKKRITTKNLALFVNAMTVACINPTNFFGVNIVSELRNRVDNSNYTNPFFILTLCNAGEYIETEDILKLKLLFEAYLRPSWASTQAMVIMALKCISKQQPHRNLNTSLEWMLFKLKRMQKVDGIVDNSKATALVIQAIIATGSSEKDFDMNMALSAKDNFMRLAYVDNEEMYYNMPILRWKSLLDINSNHCESIVKTDFQEMNDSRKISNDGIQVQISIIIGDDMDFTRSWSIKVPSTFSFYQLLENISSSEPEYLMQFTDVEGKPYLTNVANYKESIEDDLFWFIYSRPLSLSDHPILLKQSPIDIEVNAVDEFILWYRSGSGTLTQEI